MDGTLTGTTILGQNGPKSNSNKVVLHTRQGSKTRTSLPNAVYC